jgi:2,3-bisphosphoglycerate-independent phosphoglycerate mutase
LLVMPDHRTPVTTRTHSADPVPFLLLDSDQWSAASVNEAPFSERFAETHGPLIADATRMIRILLEREEFPR